MRNQGASATSNTGTNQFYRVARTALATYDPSQLDPEVRHLYHGEPETIAAVLETLDGRLRQPLNLSDTEIAELVAFLKAGRMPGDPESVAGRPMPGFAWLPEADLAGIAAYIKARHGN